MMKQQQKQIFGQSANRIGERKKNVLYGVLIFEDLLYFQTIGHLRKLFKRLVI